MDLRLALIQSNSPYSAAWRFGSMKVAATRSRNPLQSDGDRACNEAIESAERGGAPGLVGGADVWAVPQEETALVDTPASGTALVELRIEALTNLAPRLFSADGVCPCRAAM